MDTGGQLAALKTRVLAAIREAANESDTSRIGPLAGLLQRIEADEKTVTTLQDNLRHYEEQLSAPSTTTGTAQALNATRTVPLGRSRMQRGRALGKEMRGIFAKDHNLTPVRSTIYSTPSHLRVGLAASTEDENRPDRWFLGLPDEELDVAVLLCQATDGQLLDFVLGREPLAAIWAFSSRSGGQVKFNVSRRNGTYQLQIPGKAPLDLGRFLRNYNALH